MSKTLQPIWIIPDDVLVIPNFFTPDTCHEHISRAEKLTFEEAGINSGSKQVVVKDVRSNDRLFVDDVPLAESVYSRLAPFVPQPFGLWETIGLNERWRYYRYEPGQEFRAHYDGSFVRSGTEMSHLTFMIYLNDGFKGGETKFVPRDYTGSLHKAEWVTVTPETGMAIIFVHRILHEGAKVLKGTKYVLRTDVMFRRKSE